MVHVGISAILLLLVMFFPSATIHAQGNGAQSRSSFMRFISERFPGVFRIEPEITAIPTARPLPSQADERIQELAHRMVTNYEARYQHYGEFIEKLQSRMEKMKSEGAGTDQAEALLARFRERYENMRLMLEQQRAMVRELPAVANERARQVTVHSGMGQVSQAFRSLHNQAEEVVRAMHVAPTQADPEPIRDVLEVQHGKIKIRPTVEIPPPRYNVRQ